MTTWLDAIGATLLWRLALLPALLIVGYVAYRMLSAEPRKNRPDDD